MRSVIRTPITSTPEGSAARPQVDADRLARTPPPPQIPAPNSVTLAPLASGMKEKGVSNAEIKKRFDTETNEARDFAYSTAKEVKRQQKK